MAKQYSVKRIRNEDERFQGGNADYVQIKQIGESFLGTALFLGDPTEDEPGYFEFFQHAQFPGVGYFPCAGEECPLCEDGHSPASRALSVWWDTKNEKVVIFEMNALVITQFSQMRAEDEKIYGRTFRISRLDDRGNYMLSPKDVDLKKGEVKEKLTESEIDLEEIMNTKLRRKMEQFGIAKALTDDDDEPVSKPKAKKQPQEPQDDEVAQGGGPHSDDWDGEEATFTISGINKKKETLTLEHEDYNAIELWAVELKSDEGEDLFSVGQEITVSASKDSDGDWIAQTIEVAEEGSEKQKGASEEEPPDEIRDTVMVITAVKVAEETLEVENDDLGWACEIWFQSAEGYDGQAVDFNDYEVGQKITVNAVKDGDGDYVFETLPEVIKAKSGKKKVAAKK